MSEDLTGCGNTSDEDDVRRIGAEITGSGNCTDEVEVADP